MSRFLRQTLELGTYIACMMIAVSVFYSLTDILKQGFVSFKFNPVTTVSLVVLLLAVFFSIKPKLKTVAILLTIVLMFIFILIGSVGFNILMNNIFDEKTAFTIFQGIIALSIGGIMSWFTFKLLRSRWLK